MAKIETIRPGGTIDSNLAEYPLAELLMGILKGNLSGRLEVMLHPEPRNIIHFRHGVPVAVQLQDLGVSLVSTLVEQGVLKQEQGLELLRVAEATGKSEQAIIEAQQLVPPPLLNSGLTQQARAQLVRLFEVGAADFRFIEGDGGEFPEGLCILQTLPIVFEGLARKQDRIWCHRYLEPLKRRPFRLGATYPHGVDPFEWGPVLEEIFTGPPGVKTLSELMQTPTANNQLEAALAALSLAEMLDTLEAPSDLLAELSPSLPASVEDSSSQEAARIAAMEEEVRKVATKKIPAAHQVRISPSEPPEVVAKEVPRPPIAKMENIVPSSPPRRVAPKAVKQIVTPAGGDGGAPAEGGGLVIHRRAAQKAPRSPSQLTPIKLPESAVLSDTPAATATTTPEKKAPSGPDAELALVAKVLKPFETVNYYQALRITPHTEAAQLDRAFRFLVRRVQEDHPPMQSKVYHGYFREAFSFLRDVARADTYAKLVEKEERDPSAVEHRRSMEVDGKIDRAVRLLGENKECEAAYVLAWAARCEPRNKVWRALVLAGEYIVFRRENRVDPKAARVELLNALQLAPHDERVRLVYARVLAQTGDFKGARSLLAEVRDTEHPLFRILEAMVRS